MSRYCLICGHHRPSEHFGGRGRRAIACKTCRKEHGNQGIDRILEMMWMEGLFEQKNISVENVARLHGLAKSSDDELQSMAVDCLAMAALGNSRKNRRFKLKKLVPKLFYSAQGHGWINGPAMPDGENYLGAEEDMVEAGFMLAGDEADLDEYYNQQSNSCDQSRGDQSTDAVASPRAIEFPPEEEPPF